MFTNRIRFILALLLTQMLLVRPALSAGASADAPYFENKDGKQEPIATECLKKDKCDKKWLTLAFPEYSGPRPRVAVMEVGNRSADASQRTNDGAQVIRVEYPGFSRANGDATAPVSGLEDLLAKSLFETHRFRMVERQKIADVLDEQDFGTSGRVSAASAARLGKVIGAEYLVATSIHEFRDDFKSGGVMGGAISGLGSGLGVGGIGFGGKKAKVVLSVRLIDASTGDIIAMETVEGTAGSSGFTVGGGGLGGGLAAGALGGKQTNQPLTYALQVSMNKAAYLVATQLAARPFSASVAMVEGSEVIISGGSDAGLKAGTVLEVFARGQEIVDPETGELLGVKNARIGAIEITRVEAKLSYARILDGCDGIKARDLVKARAGGA